MKSTRSKKSKPATSNRKPRPYRPPGSLAFPDVRGKTVAGLYLTADLGIHSITLNFDDQTAIVFDIDVEPRLEVEANFSDWSTGNRRVLCRWPARRTR